MIKVRRIFTMDKYVSDEFDKRVPSGERSEFIERLLLKEFGLKIETETKLIPSTILSDEEDTEENSKKIVPILNIDYK